MVQTPPLPPNKQVAAGVLIPSNGKVDIILSAAPLGDHVRTVPAPFNTHLFTSWVAILT